MKELPVRKKIRLEGYDYSSEGCYYITICVKDRHEMLGKITPKVGAIINRPQVELSENVGAIPRVELSEYGKIAENALNAIPEHYDGVTIDKYVIMPNHIHLILILRNNYDENGRLIVTPARVPAIIQQFKRTVTKQAGFSLWQKSYHDQILRNKAEYLRKRQYINQNPAKWMEDCYYPPANRQI